MKVKPLAGSRYSGEVGEPCDMTARHRVDTQERVHWIGNPSEIFSKPLTTQVRKPSLRDPESQQASSTAGRGARTPGCKMEFFNSSLPPNHLCSQPSPVGTLNKGLSFSNPWFPIC